MIYVGMTVRLLDIYILLLALRVLRDNLVKLSSARTTMSVGKCNAGAMYAINFSADPSVLLFEIPGLPASISLAWVLEG